MLTAAIIIVYILVCTALMWVYLFHSNRPDYLLKVTCNDLVVVQTELVELEALCDLSKTESVSWQFFPPTPEGQPQNVVKVQVLRV